MDAAERAEWVAETVRETRAHVRPLEHRYGCTSEEMWNRWQAGEEPEDEAGQEEVFDWMMHWRLLRDILANPRFEDLIPPDDPAGDEAASASRAERVRLLLAQTRVVTLEEELAELMTNVREMEARYECTSEYMMNAVLAGTERETDEICQWLMNYHELQRILASDEYAARSGTATTSSSTTARWPASARTES